MMNNHRAVFLLLSLLATHLVSATNHSGEEIGIVEHRCLKEIAVPAGKSAELVNENTTGLTEAGGFQRIPGGEKHTVVLSTHLLSVLPANF